tara:strand:+ start:419 stop:886 length:468 start_codon:yes stop_codon:yes gene_type:complete
VFNKISLKKKNESIIFIVMDENNNEYKIFGLTIEKLSIFYGLFLVLWGVLISFISGSDSFTSYIPSILGLPILILSFFSIKFSSRKKLFMHIVVLIGLIIFLGGLDFIRSLVIGNAFDNIWADISKLMMLITGLIFVYQCIKSFMHAKKVRELNS